MSDKSNNKNQTYYDILGLTSDASPLEIKTAYRTLALQYHPENRKTKPTDEEEEEDDDDEDYEVRLRFRQVGEAYRCLSDEKERKLYDRELKPYGEYRSLSQSRPPPLPTAAATTTKRRPKSFVGMPYQHPYHLRSLPQKQKQEQPQPQQKPSSSSSHFNPYQQFDDLFRSDPFFHESILLEADEAFAQRFNQGNIKNLNVADVYSRILQEEDDYDDKEAVGGGDYYESSSLSSTISSSNISSLSSLESDKLKRNGKIVIEHQLGATAPTAASSTAGNADDEGFWLTKLLHQCGIQWDTTSTTATFVHNDNSGQDVGVGVVAGVETTTADDNPVEKETTKITQSLTVPSESQPKITNDTTTTGSTNPSPAAASSATTTTDTQKPPATTTTATTTTTSTTTPTTATYIDAIADKESKTPN